MKTLKTILIALFVGTTFLTSCNKDDGANKTEEAIAPVAFDPNNYSEYLTCKVGDFQYNTGNSTGNTTSIVVTKIAGTLYLSTSDGNFIPGTTPSMEMNFQFKNFDAVTPKSYEVSGTYPTQISKYKHVSADDYDTNNGVNTTPQANSITVTKIENGYCFGTFAFTVYKTSNRNTTQQVTLGHFKFKLLK